MQPRRNVETERPGGLEIDHQLERGWLHHWKLCRLGAVENAARVYACLPIGIGDIRAIANAAASCCKLTKWIDRWDFEASRTRDDVRPFIQEERIGSNEECVGFLCSHRIRGSIKVARCAGIEHRKLQPQ